MKIITAYDHKSHDLSFIYLALMPIGSSPQESDWKPAYRDIINGQRVVWIIDEWNRRSVLWLRDRTGERRVKIILERR